MEVTVDDEVSRCEQVEWYEHDFLQRARAACIARVRDLKDTLSTPFTSLDKEAQAQMKDAFQRLSLFVGSESDVISALRMVDEDGIREIKQKTSLKSVYQVVSKESGVSLYYVLPRLGSNPTHYQCSCRITSQSPQPECGVSHVSWCVHVMAVELGAALGRVPPPSLVSSTDMYEIYAQVIGNMDDTE